MGMGPLGMLHAAAWHSPGLAAHLPALQCVLQRAFFYAPSTWHLSPSSAGQQQQQQQLTWAHPAHQVQMLRQQHSQSTASRVNPAMTRAMPFSVSRKDAEDTFWAYQRSSRFLAEPTSYEKVKELFLPYWLVQLVVSSHATHAQVGNRVFVNRMNPSTRRMEGNWETQWRMVTASYVRNASYAPEQVDMQVCASSKFLAADAAKLRPGELVMVGDGLGLLKPITHPGLLTGDRRVLPFTMRPAVARERALKWVQRQERAAAEQWFKATFRADEVQGVNLEVQVVQQASFPLYVPVYAFKRVVQPSLLQGVVASLTGQPQPSSLKLYTLVSGAALGVVAGSKIYDPMKVGIAAALAAPIVLTMTGLLGVLRVPHVFLFGSVLPGLTAATIARHSPYLRHTAQRAQTALPSFGAQLLQALLGPRLSRILGLGVPAAGAEDEAHAAHERMEDEWVRAYTRHATQGFGAAGGAGTSGNFGGWSRGRAHARQQAEAGWSRPEPAYPASDPKGYYQLLGVPRNASTAEIQESFRSKALQQHPDKFSDPGDKAKATAAFQKLSEAYSVLRSPAKRAAYDSGNPQA